MPDEQHVVKAVDWKAVLPFTVLFRSFRIAIHPSKLVLGLAALFLIWLGGSAIDKLWPSSARAFPGELQMFEASSGSPTEGSEEFNRRHLAARKDMDAAYKAALKEIGHENGGLADLKWAIKTRRNEAVAAVNKIYDASDKSEKATAERNKALMEIYSASEDAWTEAKQLAGTGLFKTLYDYEISVVSRLVKSVGSGNWLGTHGVIDCCRHFFITAPTWAIRHHPVFCIVFFVWFLLVWSIFGGAIARIAAVHVARDEKISIRSALSFSTGKFLSFFSAPLIPMLIVVGIAVVVGVAGLLTNIPGLGPIVVGALFVLAIVAGFVMTLVVFGTLGGFSLMYPTIAVEGSDSFDAISRSFSYLYARPWRLAFYSFVAIAYGSLTFLFVRYFIYYVLLFTHKAVRMMVFTTTDGGANVFSAMWPSPATLGRLTYDVNYLSLGPGESAGAFLISLWVHLAIGLLGAFAISFYLSANTIIYYLMRHEVDATEMDDVYLEQSEDEFAESTTVVSETTTQTSAPQA